MSYASLGTIEATDFNNLAWGGTQGTYTTTPNNIAYVMGVGNGVFGYGQSVTNLNTVSVAGSVTATQWSGLVTELNAALGHQGGTQVTPSPTITAGNTITYESAVNTAVTTINTNKASYYANGTTANGTYENTSVAPGTATYNQAVHDKVASFGSADECRYFFNAGGYLQYQITTTNMANNTRETVIAGQVTQTNAVNLFNTSCDMVGAGTGYTTVENTSKGYRNLTTAYQELTRNTSTGTYAGDYTQVAAKIDTSVTTNGSISAEVRFRTYIYSVTDVWASVSGTVSCRINVIPPETTYLTDSWGTITIT